MGGSVQLDYAVSTDPFPLQASPGTGELVTCVLTITASNPAQDPSKNPVTIKGVQITLPLGDAGNALTDSPASIGAVAPDGWTLQSGTDAGVYAFVPTAGSAVVTDVSLEFVFNDVQINRQPGTVEHLLVMEGSGGCQPPDCPVDDLSGTVTKFPAGWGSVQFWVNPPDIPAGAGTTLHWSGPEGATYTIEYAADDKVVNVPAIGQPALANEGQWPGQSDPPLCPSATTVFTLTVTETSSGNSYAAQEQKTVTVQEGPPTIESFGGQVAYAGGGTYDLTFSWTTDSSTRYCLIPQAGSDELAPDSPPQGDSLQVKAPHPGTFDLQAHNDAGSTTSTLTLEWAMTAQISGINGIPMPAAAVSPDGARLYLTSEAGLAVYALPDDPSQAPTQIGSWPLMPFVAVTAVAAGTQDLVWVVAVDQTGLDSDTALHFMPALVSPQGTVDPTGTTTSVDGGDGSGPYFLAAAPGGSPLYLADGEGAHGPGPRVWVYAVGSQSSLTLAGSTSTGGWAVGAAVASDGSVYTTDLDNAYRYTPTADGLTLAAKQLLGNVQQRTGLRAVVVAGETLFVARPADVLVLDRISLQPVRPALGVTGVTLAAAPGGLRLFAFQWNAGCEGILAPSALTGGNGP
jgi:hypothetical protein